MTWRDELRARTDGLTNVTVAQVDVLELLDLADDFDRTLVAMLQVLDADTYAELMTKVGELRGDPRLRHMLDLLSQARRFEPL